MTIGVDDVELLLDVADELDDELLLLLSAPVLLVQPCTSIVKISSKIICKYLSIV